MIRHTQLVLADPERSDGHSAAGEAGDCLRTCVASMLDVIDPTSVPNFAGIGSDDDWGWYIALREWARGLGADFSGVRVQWPIPYEGDNHPSAVIATGKSPRGEWLHSVLVDAETGELVHDPHPSGDGLAGPIEGVLAFTDPYDPPPAEQVAEWIREEKAP